MASISKASDVSINNAVVKELTRFEEWIVNRVQNKHTAHEPSMTRAYESVADNTRKFFCKREKNVSLQSI
jgi:hypothetical protein